MSGRLRTGAAVLFLALTLALAPACSHSKSHAPAATVAASATAVPATPTPAARDIGSLIGARGDLPKNDPIALSAAYGRTHGRAPASKPFAGEANVGDTRTFTVTTLSGSALAQETPPGITTITATLRAKSAHAYFYEDDALNASTPDVQAAADQFEATVWPTVTAAFGLPAIPGVDGDPRIIVLQADLGGGVGGYVSQDDQYLKAVRPLSNEAEMLYMDRTLKPGSAGFNVVLAHEFQHVIHAHTDPYEEAWVNEGLSEDASMLVGGAVSTIDSFERKPDTQLNAWTTEGSAPHYGAGAAFFRYLTSRFGGDPSYGVIAHEAGDGATGVDEFLQSVNAKERFGGVFADWIAANILNAADEPYANPKRAMDMSVGQTLEAGSPAGGNATQFGTDYYKLSLAGGDYVLTFDGAKDVPVLPAQTPDGLPLWWGNAEDNIDTTMTFEADLTQAKDPALTFKTWYDIERWFDWGYVSVSTDGGQTWTALAGAQTTSDDPVKTAYGPGYTGKSGGGATPAWVDERISLAAYAGKKVQIRFEYVTDGATHGEGWAVEDYGVTSAAPGGSAMKPLASRGWLEADTPLQQTYTARVIEKMADGSDAVKDVPVDGNGHGTLRFSADGVKEATLAIAGTTDGTDQKPKYTVRLDRP